MCPYTNYVIRIHKFYNEDMWASTGSYPMLKAQFVEITHAHYFRFDFQLSLELDSQYGKNELHTDVLE